jgi:hypothetical protein
MKTWEVNAGKWKYNFPQQFDHMFDSKLNYLFLYIYAFIILLIYLYVATIEVPLPCRNRFMVVNATFNNI